MDEQKNSLQTYEGIIDDFIEDLIREKKPRACSKTLPQTKWDNGEHEESVMDLEKMFETVRAVKRMRGHKVRRRVYQYRWFRGMAAIAAALLIVLGIGILRPGLLPQANMVEAVVKAYEELQSYSGIVEIRGERGETVEFRETIQVDYKKPFKYAAVHRYSDYEMRYLSDGERLAVIEPGKVIVDNLFPEKELWRFYHIGTTVLELKAAAEVESLGTEKLFERESTLLRYTYSGDSESHYLWIDKATNLPLRKVLNHPEGTRLVVEFRELEINPALDESIFALNWPAGSAVHEINQTVPPARVQVAWPQAAELPQLLPAGLELWQAGELEEGHLYEYVLRHRGEKETDFLDIFFTSTPRQFFYLQGSRLGRLGGGYVEVNAAVRNIFENYIGDSRMARWVRNDGEIFIVSNRSTAELETLLERLAGEKITGADARELQQEGLEPAYEKEGH